MALIEVSHLRKVYSTEGVDTVALDDVSLTIEKGEFLAIMGPSGSGKSTLMHILGFLDTPSGGAYRFAGKLFEEYSKSEVAFVRNQKMGFVFQAFNLLPRTTVFDNVKLPLMYSDTKESEWKDRTLSAINAVGLSHRVHHSSSQLSGGEKQRVAIARALVNDPELIFADEPTGNLDSKSGQQVMEIIQSLNEEHGHTVILVTHETYTAELARRIVRVHDGRIVSDERVDHRKEARNKFVK